jgi:hypothetical protein
VYTVKIRKSLFVVLVPSNYVHVTHFIEVPIFGLDSLDSTFMMKILVLSVQAELANVDTSVLFILRDVDMETET